MLSRISSKDKRILERLYMSGCEVRLFENMSCRTSISIGGPVKAFVLPHTLTSLMEAYRVLESEGEIFKVMGHGTNLLVSDSYLDIYVLSTGYVSGLEIHGDVLVAEGGASLKGVIERAMEEGLGGMEELYGIPGSVGGAVFMNAGAYGKEIKDVLLWAEIFDGKGVVRLSAEDLGLSYRRSNIKDEVVLRAAFKLERKDGDEVLKRMRYFLRRRLEKQPVFERSAGSIFKRPRQDFYVGSTLEKLGFKGYRVGKVKISEKHAGFMVNEGGGTFEEAMRLVDVIKGKVKDEYGIELEMEVVVWK